MWPFRKKSPPPNPGESLTAEVARNQSLRGQIETIRKADEEKQARQKRAISLAEDMIQMATAKGEFSADLMWGYPWDNPFSSINKSPFPLDEDFYNQFAAHFRSLGFEVNYRKGSEWDYDPHKVTISWASPEE